MHSTFTDRWRSTCLLAACLAGCGAQPTVQTQQPEPAASATQASVVPVEVPPIAPPVPAAEPTLDGSSQPTASLALREPPSEMHRELDAIAAEIEAGRATQARSRLVLLQRELGTSGSLDEAMTGRALLARAHDRLGAKPAASAEYEKVLGLWEKDRELAGVKRGEGARDHVRMAHALSAIAEALFFQAERLRERADALRMPSPPPSTYKPSSKPVQDMNADEFQREMEKRAEETKKLKAHIDGAVKRWVEEKRRRVTEAERAYARIPQLKPAAPPLWVVAAAAHVGTLWSDFADEFLSTPSPRWLANDADLLEAYRRNIEESCAPIVEHARGAFEMCEQAAETYRIDTEASRTCKQWLDAHR